MNTSDYIAILALFVSAYAVYQTHQTNKRSEAARREAEAAQAMAERRGLMNSVFLEAHGLADDVRLHGGAIERTRQRANALSHRSDVDLNLRVVPALHSVDGKRIEAEDAYKDHAKLLLAEGVHALASRSTEELELMLRDLKKARGRVRLLIEETDALLST